MWLTFLYLYVRYLLTTSKKTFVTISTERNTRLHWKIKTTNEYEGFLEYCEEEHQI